MATLTRLNVRGAVRTGQTWVEEMTEEGSFLDPLHCKLAELTGSNLWKSTTNFVIPEKRTTTANYVELNAVMLERFLKRSSHNILYVRQRDDLRQQSNLNISSCIHAFVTIIEERTISLKLCCEFLLLQNPEIIEFV